MFVTSFLCVFVVLTVFVMVPVNVTLSALSETIVLNISCIVIVPDILTTYHSKDNEQ